MSFIADKQTLEDLNLPGKYKQQSVFSLFNKVKTAGGEKLLGSMFQTPLSDHEAINRRSAIFQWFQRKQIAFPFSNEPFSQMESWLGGVSANNYLATWLSLAKKKLSGAIVRDEEYRHIQTGLRQTIALLNDCKIFINRFEDSPLEDSRFENSPLEDSRIEDSHLEEKKEPRVHPFQEQLRTVKNILNDPRLQGLTTGQGGSGTLSLRKTARYDHLLRHTMRASLATVMDTLYQLDLYIAVAGLARERGFSYARALAAERNLFEAVELSHPGIEKAVANPVSFTQESNMIFLTGANMAGKSTFMKAVGINAYLAHMGFPVAAKEMQFSVKEGIYSSINVSDNLNMGYSHFYAEVLRVKKVAEEVSKGKGLVILFDELFKGTNVKDAYDATLAVTAGFCEYRNCLFIISTHIIEAGEVLRKEQEGIQLRYLPTLMNGSLPAYTYRLQPGISSDRHGMMIIENEGILELLK